MTHRQVDQIADAIRDLPLGCDGAAIVKLAEAIADVLQECGHDREAFLERACDLG